MARWSYIDINRPNGPRRRGSGERGNGNDNGQLPPRSGPGRQETIRRRRLAALVGGAALLVGALALIGGTGPSRAHSTSHRRAVSGTSKSAAQVAQESAARLNSEEESAITRVLSYAPAVVEGGSRGNDVALTFDDGPGPYTVKLVEELGRLHVHATFFVVGNMERYFSAGTLAELRLGDVIGDHTESHPMMATLPAKQQLEQLTEQLDRVEVLGAPRPRLFRPPYGSFNATTLKELRSLHLLMVLWSTDTGDYARPGVQTIVSRALAGAHPGAIILMHDAGGERAETIAALPAIVAGLRKRGLRPVTVPQLLLDDPPLPGRTLPNNLSGG